MLFQEFLACIKKQQGVLNEVFSVTDARHLIAKANLWKERDEAIKAKVEKLNNETLPIELIYTER